MLSVSLKTKPEALKEIYIISVKIWFIIELFWLLFLFVLFYVFPNKGILLDTPLDIGSGIFLAIITSICFFPIAIINAYKTWIIKDASLIWLDPIKKIAEIKESIIKEYRKMPLAAIYWWLYSIQRIPSSSLIFNIYMEERNKAAQIAMESGEKINNS